jgi:uncharacterized HAD superfamily protein
LRTWIRNWIERKRFQKWVELEERHLYCKILKNQLEVIRLTLKEMKREERFERMVRKRKPEAYIC